MISAHHIDSNDDPATENARHWKMTAIAIAITAVTLVIAALTHAV